MAEIKMHNGRPAIFIEDKPYPPMMATIRTINDSEIHFDRDYFVNLGKAGVRIFFLICDTVWLKPNALELFDQEARALLDAIPDAYIMPRMGLHPTNKWIEEHPGEVIRYSDGSSPAVHLFSESYETDLPAHYSLCSSKWREDAGRALEETWKLLMELPYADRIIGCFLAAGGTSEWYYMLPTYDNEKKTALGHSEAFKREFSQYLTETYQTDENLRKHWKNPEATLEHPPIPEYDKHYFAGNVDTDAAIPSMRMYTNCPVPPPPGNGTNMGSFADFDKNLDIYDFYRAWHLGSANSVLYFARVIKELTPDRLVGAFYGSQGCINFVESGSNGGTVKVLESEYVDFLAAPGVYENRLPGGFEGQREVQDSFALHNKIYIVEQDTRTLGENRYFMDKYGIYDMTDSLNVMKREFGRNICEDVQAWWFDQLLGGRRYKFPEIYELIGKQQKIAEEAYTLNRKKDSEIAFIFDEETMCSVSFQTTRDVVELMRNYEIARIGAPVDQYYHNDMADPAMPSYKMYVFFNTFVLSEEERRVIRKKLQKDGAVAVWIYAPGVLEPMAEQKFSTKHMEQLTGMKFSMVNERFDGGFRFDGETHPISGKIDKRAIYGKFDRNRIMGLPPAENARWDTYLYPLFWADDPKVKHLGHFVTSGYPSVSVKECDGFHSVYYASKSIKCDVLRELARFAGCHIYCESDDVTYMCPNYVTLHASSTGEKKLVFPRKVSPYEVYEEKFYGHGVTEITFEAYLGETKMFRLVEEG